MNRRLRSRLLLALPFVLFAIFFAGYTVVWNRAAQAVEEEIAAFAAREAAAGRSFTYSSVNTAGYPFFLRGSVNDVTWRQAALGGFKAEEVIIAAVPYNPTRIVFAPRGEQTLTMGTSQYEVTSDDLRFNLEDGFVAAEAHGLRLEGDSRTLTIKDLIANQANSESETTIAVAVNQVTLGGRAETRIPYFNLSASRTRRGLDIEFLTIGIGRSDDPSPTQLSADGDFELGPEGTPSGALTLRFKNERPLLGILSDSGALDRDTVMVANSILGLMTDSGTKEITLPLSIDDGVVSLGVVSLGRVPDVTL